MTVTAAERLVESTVECEMKPNFTIGVQMAGEPLKVTKLLPSSCFLGKLFVGDVILSVNEQKITNLGDFFKVSKGQAKLSIRIKRDEYCTCKVNVLAAPKPGFEAFDFEMNWRTGGMPIGILVYQDSEKRVIVSMIESGTLASHNLKPGDQLTKVNDTVIADKAAAKKLILDSVNAHNKVKLTVERPSAAAMAAAANAKPAAAPPAAVKLPNYDLPLPADVLAILEANKNFHKESFTGASILKSAPKENANEASVVMPTGSHINIPDGTAATLDEQQIEFDPSPKPLKVTPKRVGAA